jgi:hypothetical protein
MLKPSFILSLAGLQQCLYRLLPPHWQSLHKVCLYGWWNKEGREHRPLSFQVTGETQTASEFCLSKKLEIESQAV